MLPESWSCFAVYPPGSAQFTKNPCPRGTFAFRRIRSNLSSQTAIETFGEDTCLLCSIAKMTKDPSIRYHTNEVTAKFQNYTLPMVCRTCDGRAGKQRCINGLTSNFDACTQIITDPASGTIVKFNASGTRYTAWYLSSRLFHSSNGLGISFH